MRHLTSDLSSRRTRRSGFSLVEIAMVLAIVALLVAGMMMFFANAANAQKTNDAMMELTVLQQIVRSLYSGQTDYSGLTSIVVSSSNQLPAKWMKGTGAAATLSGPFIGIVDVVEETTTHKSFLITFGNIPDASCTRIATNDLGTGLLSVSVNGTVVSAMAFTPANANTACSGKANKNVIIWNFV